MTEAGVISLSHPNMFESLKLYLDVLARPHLALGVHIKVVSSSGLNSEPFYQHFSNT